MPTGAYCTKDNSLHEYGRKVYPNITVNDNNMKY